MPEADDSISRIRRSAMVRSTW